MCDLLTIFENKFRKIENLTKKVRKFRRSYKIQQNLP